MAITQSALTSGVSNTNGTSYATASVSPTANRLVVVAVFGNALSVANGADPTGVSGAGLTFVKWKAISNTSAGMSLSLWRAMSASPSSGAITITWANTFSGAAWSVFELAGVDTSGSNGSGAVNSNTASAEDLTATVATKTATLAAFAGANNGAVCATGWFNASGTAPTCTPDTGWTEIHDVGIVDTPVARAIETQWRADNDTTAQGTWTANGAIQTIAAEVVAGITATLSSTLGAASSSSGATLAIAGSASPTLGSLSSSAAGALSLQASATPTLGALTVAGTAANAIAADASNTLATVTGSSAATLDIGPALAKTLDPATVLASGTIAIAASVSPTLAALTSSAAASLAIRADLGVTLGTLTLESAGSTQGEIQAELSATLGAVTAGAAGALAIAATCTKTLDALAAGAAASVAVAADLAKTLGAATLSSDVRTGISEASVEATLGALSSSAAATVAVVADANITLGAVTLSSAADGLASPEAESNAGRGGSTRLRKKLPRFHVPPREPIRARLVGQLDDLTLDAAAVIRDTPEGRMKKLVFAAAILH